MVRSIIHWIFATCLLMGLLLLAITMAETTVNAGGIPHPEFPGMVVGEDGAARLAYIGTFAFLFQSFLLLLVVLLSILGVSERNRSTKLLIMMGATYALMMLAWWQMFSSHQSFLETGETGYFMGFPTATAWQVYGTWLGAIPLIVIYVVGFRDYIYSEEDEAAFKQLLEEAKGGE